MYAVCSRATPRAMLAKLPRHVHMLGKLPAAGYWDCRVGLCVFCCPPVSLLSLFVALPRRFCCLYLAALHTKGSWHATASIMEASRSCRAPPLHTRRRASLHL